MSHEHPLAYLLGIEGTALLRSFVGDCDFDREFAQARIAEIRRLPDDKKLCGAGISVGRVDAPEGYNIWAHTYDTPGNGAFPYEEPYLRRVLDTQPPTCSILDAACGTGCYSEYLAAQGHRVIGVDSSPGMLARDRPRAQRRLPPGSAPPAAAARQRGGRDRLRTGADPRPGPAAGARRVCPRAAAGRPSRDRRHAREECVARLHPQGDR